MINCSEYCGFIFFYDFVAMTSVCLKRVIRFNKKKTFFRCLIRVSLLRKWRKMDREWSGGVWGED